MATVTQTSPNPVWRRWFRRTNVHIAEYIVMLVLVGSFLGLLSSLWFSLFTLIQDAGYVAVVAAAAQMAGLLVVGPAAFWTYSRVTGQEMIQPELERSKARTVFLTIWMLFATLSIVGLGVTIATATVSSIFGLADDFGTVLVGSILPGLLAIATITFGLFMVVKHTTRKFVMLSAIVLAAMAVVLLLANGTAVIVNKDKTGSGTVENTMTTDERDSRSNQNTDDECTLSKYVSEECSYSDYLDDSRSSVNSSRPSSNYDEYGLGR